jgi:SPX domain protein involved in polyphosphate accumulation
MQPDKHTSKYGRYAVRSLYFDTHAYKAYHDKLAGTAERHKLRVRAYGEDPTQSGFIRFEVKSRYVSFIHKITVDMPMSDYQDAAPVIYNRALPPERLMNDESLSKEFFRIQRQYNMTPTILINYRREAYEKVELNRVRANFDDELLASRNLDLLGPLKGARNLLKYGSSIFEIKVDGTMPFWMHTLISKYNLQNQSVSKFCHGIRSEARFSGMAREDD